MAGTTGSVKSFAESEAKFETKKSVSNDQKEIETNTTKSYKVGKIGVETEVKVKGSGLSFGGTFQAEKLSLDPAPTKANFLDHSKVWAKYELPELKGVKSYVQATAEPKFIGGPTDKGSAELEGQASYKYGTLTFGLNSKTNFPFIEKTSGKYENDVKSTHKVFVETEKDKDVFVKGLKDVKANVEVKHDYRKIEQGHKASEAVDYVSGEVSAKYNAVKDLELEGKVAFKKNIKSSLNIEKYEVLGTELFGKGFARYIHSYEIKGTYTGVKHLTLSAKPFVAHVNVKEEIDNSKLKKEDNVLYGVELGAEYKMLNDKLTLTGKTLLAGVHDRKFDESKNTDAEKLVKENLGYFVFDANAKYDYSVTDKFTVSPEANANLELNVAKEADKLVTKPTLTLTPKVSAKYVPVEELTIEGNVSVPVKFGVVTKSFGKVSNDDTKYDSANPVKGFGYDSTSIKTSLNLKYEWK